MPASDRRNSWGFSLFCDDLRLEVGGKVSVVGLYQHDYLFEGSFPHLAPKLCILIMYYEIARAISSDIEIRIHMPGSDTPASSIKLLRKELPAANAPAPPDLEPGQEALFHLRVPVTLSPLVVEQEGRIKVRAHYDDGTILHLGTLHFRALRPDEVITRVPAF